MLKFITGNKNKFEEIQTVVGFPLKQTNIDLPELQEIDAYAIIKAKLIAAQKFEDGEYIVEDTSLYLECLGNKLPGPLVKWFEKGIGNEGILEITERFTNNKATAVTLIGLITKQKEIHFFEGKVKGTIVSPTGDKDFGWGPYFVPEGKNKTFGEMEREEKHEVSMRAKAAEKLKAFLENK